MGRSDGVRLKDIPRYRRMMPIFLRTKMDSVVYYDVEVKAERMVEMAERLSEEYGMRVTPFHLIMHSLYKTHVAYPNVNRFIKGGKIWQRKGIQFSFSVKKEMSTKASISIVKRSFDQGITLKDTVKLARKDTRDGRDRSKRDQADRESGLYTWIPPIIKKMLFPAYKFLDEYDLLPSSYTAKDPLYASVFVANVGAFNADAGYHHLYELGTVSCFLVVGRIRKRPVVENDRVVPRLILPIKATYDERVEDGFYYYRALDYFTQQLEEPERLLQDPELVEE